MILISRGCFTKKGEEPVYAVKSQRQEDDTETIIAVDYTDEEDEFNDDDDDYDSVPTNKNLCNSDSNDSLKDHQTSG